MSPSRSLTGALPRGSGLVHRSNASSTAGARVDFLARRWAEYRYPDTLAAHLAGHALVRAGMLLAAPHVAGPHAGWILAVGLLAAALWIHWAPALLTGGLCAAVLLAGRALQAVAGPDALWPMIAPATCVLAGTTVLLSARHVYQDLGAHLAMPRRERWYLSLVHPATGGPLQLFFLLVHRGFWPSTRHLLTERAVLRFASEEGRPWRNWARTHAWSASRVWFPANVQDLVEIVKLARRERRRIRVVGTAYSWEPLASTEDFLVCQCLMREVSLDLSDPSRPRAVVGAGANGRELNRLLEQNGYSIPTNVVMETVSWGGMISVGAHGSGWDEGTLSDLVEAVELVDGAGRRRRFERGVDSDIALDTVRLALGLCGMIHRITLRVQPAFNVSLMESLRPIEDALASLSEEVPAHDYYDVYWFPFTERAWVRTWDRTTLPAGPPPRQRLLDQHTQRNHRGLWLGVVQMRLGPILDWLMARFPSWTPTLVRFKVRHFSALSRVCRIEEATHFRSGLELYRVGCAEVAFAIDPAFENVRRAWRIVDEHVSRWAAAGKFPLNMTINARFVKSSTCLLSPAHGNERTCYIEILGGHENADWNTFMAEVLTAWMALPNARVHWGKQYGHVPGIARLVRDSLGADLPRFLRVRRELDLDPDDLFSNPFLTRLLLADAPDAGARAPSPIQEAA